MPKRWPGLNLSARLQGGSPGASEGGQVSSNKRGGGGNDSDEGPMAFGCGKGPQKPELSNQHAHGIDAFVHVVCVLQIYSCGCAHRPGMIFFPGGGVLMID